MGVLRSGVVGVSSQVSACKKTAVEKIQEDCVRAQKALDMYVKMISEVSVVKQTADTVKALLEQIASMKYVLWSKEKAYQFWCYVAQQISLLMKQMSAYTSYPAGLAYDTLGEVHLKLITFIGSSFDKLDDSLVTPVCYSTRDGALVVAKKTKSAAELSCEFANKNVIVPTTKALTNNVVEPAKKGAVSTKNCLLSTGAWVDTKMQLTEWLLFAAQRSQKYDNMYLGGFASSKAGLILETAKSADTRYLSGAVTEIACETYGQYKSAKAKTSKTLTSAGAPVM